MSRISLSVRKGKVQIQLKKDTIAELSYFLRRGEQIQEPHSINILSDIHIEVIFEFARITDILTITPDLITVNREWDISLPGKWQLSFTCQSGLDSVEEWVVPSVMYGKNRLGSGKYPRGNWKDGWSFREDRISIPSCSLIHNRENYQAVFCSPAGEEKFISSIKTFSRKKRPMWEIRIPYSEEPFTYTEKGIMLGGLTGKSEKLLHLKKNDLPFSYSRRFYIHTGKFTHLSEAYKRLFDLAWLKNSPLPYSPPDWNHVAELKLRHLRFLTEVDSDKNTAYLKMGKGNGLFQSYYEFTSASFLVKSLEAAVIYARTDLPGDLRLAEQIGRYFLPGVLPNGLHQDMRDMKKGKWGGYLGAGGDSELAQGVNTRANGEVMTNYLRLHRLLKENNIERPDFWELAYRNALFYIRHQLKSGGFGRWWSTDGKPLNTLGTNGTYIINLLIELEKAGIKNKEIDRALKKAGKYYLSLAKKNAFYADTLDADCVDKEAACALLRAFLNLYERCPDKNYLRGAKQVASFILTWIWSYDTCWPDGSPCREREVRTTGLTAVSVAHHHLDFYGLMIGYDFLRLWRATGEAEWKEYALALIYSCAQLIADEWDSLGRGAEFIGWQPEQIYQTNWNYKHRWLGTKGHFDVCVAWVVVLTLGAMFDIREEFPDIIRFELQ